MGSENKPSAGDRVKGLQQPQRAVISALFVTCEHYFIEKPFPISLLLFIVNLILLNKLSVVVHIII